MPFEPWYIELTEPGAGTRTIAGNGASALTGGVITSGGAATGQTSVTVAVTPADLAALQAQLFAAVAAEAAVRAGADTSEITTRSAADTNLQGEIDALHAADAQIYNILINGTGTGGGGGGGGPDRNDNGAFGIACIGTNTGTAAYKLATTGSNLAWEAFIMAGTVTATSPDRNDNGAFSIACIGTNTGTTAYWLAKEALSIASTATNSGTAGFAAADQAIFQVESIAVSGSTTANSALSTANLALATAQSGSSTGRAIVLCSAFTPTSIGADAAEIIVPYATNGSTSFPWNVRRAEMRVQTNGTTSIVAIEKSTTTGAFSAVSVGTVTLSSGSYEASTVGSMGTVDSGNKLRFNPLTLGTAQNWTIIVEIAYP